MKKIAILICLFTLIASPVFAVKDAEDIVKEVRERYEDLKTLKADFTQTMVWSLAGEESSISGVFYAKGDKFRVETELQTIVSDGKTVWTHTKDKNQVIINSIEKDKSSKTPRSLMLQYTQNNKPKLNGEVKFDGEDCYDISFFPEKPDAFILSTRVLIDKDKWLALRIEQEDINENITRYELANYQINKSIKNDFFSFTPAADAEVMDLR